MKAAASHQYADLGSARRDWEVACAGIVHSSARGTSYEVPSSQQRGDPDHLRCAALSRVVTDRLRRD